MLFTDIVGSTAHAARLGDRAWRDVVERHHAVVRRSLHRFGGREMDTAGDGFFAVFESPERAVSCAREISTDVRPLGIGIRAGVHTGECEQVDGKVGGMAVTIGSRVASLGGAGDVLVTSSVRDLMVGSAIGFSGEEQHSLKGVDDQWRVYRVVDQEPGGTDRVSSPLPVWTRRRRRTSLIAAAVAVAVLLVAVPVLVVSFRSPDSVSVGADQVGVLEPGSPPRVSAAIPVGQRPTAIASADGVVWVTNSTSGSVSRIDEKTHLSVPIPTGSSPQGLAIGAGAVWVANSGDATITRIDPATSQTTTIPVQPGPTGVVVARGRVWVTSALDASVTAINPATRQPVRVIPVGSGPTGIAFGAGALWVTNQAAGTVSRIDPSTYAVDSPIAVGAGPTGIAVGDGAAWVTNNLDGSLWRIDVHDATVSTLTLAKEGGAYAVVVSGDSVWVSSEYAGRVDRVDARTLRRSATVLTDGAPLGLAMVSGRLWFATADGGRALHRGGALTLVGDGLPDARVLDPSDDYANFSLFAVTNDGLVGYRRTDGVQGGVLVPDLATTLPVPTDGGRTYTFHLRRGLRYSTGEPVRAGDFRRAIERTVLHDGGTYQYFSDAFPSAAACRAAIDRATVARASRPTACDLDDDIVVDDGSGTVTFHLGRPVPELLYQLSLPAAYAVPEDTPLDLPPGHFLPATGPYQIASYTPAAPAQGGQAAHLGAVRLERNPRFREWSRAAQPAGYPDRIAITGVSSGTRAVDMVRSGRADALWGPVPPDQVARSQTGSTAQLHVGAGTFVRYLFLNTTKPPFDNLDARRAVAFAVDRQELATRPPVFAGPVTCQLIPPGFPGYAPYCPFSLGTTTTGGWRAPDVPRALDLVRRSGTAGRRVRVIIPDLPIFAVKGRIVVDVLNRLGYRARLRSEPKLFDGFAADPSHAFEAGLSGWGADYPAASNYIAPLATCPQNTTSNVNYSGYCNGAFDAGVAAASRLQVSDPGAASSAWAALDRAAVLAAADIPLFGESRRFLVGRRAGNVLVNPQYGLLVGQLWVQ